MLFSLGLVILCGMAAGRVSKSLRLPPLFGMLAVGMILGPCSLDLLSDDLLHISSELRRIALIVILLRAGLNLKLDDLKKVGRPALLMCFLPATFEILGMLLLAPAIMKLSPIDSLLLGTVIAAVSPAVIVPHMLKVMERGYGNRKGIPQMILAGASADDVFVIVLFTSSLGIAADGSFSPLTLLRIPTSIILGIAAGYILGHLLYLFIERTDIDSTRSMVVMLCIGFLLVTLEDLMDSAVGFSGLIAIMTMGLVYREENGFRAEKISAGFSKLWIVAEILLFVLVGASVNIDYAMKAGGSAILLVLLALLFRMAGVALCVLKTDLDRGERIFTMLAYTPKATVQAAIGAIPLSMGLRSGETILTVAVVAILVTAPLGAFLIDNSYFRLLKKD